MKRKVVDDVESSEVAEDSRGDARPMIVRADWCAVLRGRVGEQRVRGVIKEERQANVNNLRHAGKRYLAWGCVVLADSVVKVPSMIYIIYTCIYMCVYIM